MGVPNTLLVRVVSKFSAAADESHRRFQNFVSFLGLGKEEEPDPASPQEREAAERAVGDVKNMIRDWFFKILENKLRAGYFSPKNRDQHPWRQEAFQYAPKMLYDKMRYAILQTIAKYASQELGYNVRIDELNIGEDAIDEKVMDLLSELQGNPQFFEDAVNAWLKQSGGLKEQTPEANVEEAKSFDRKEYQPGMAEAWFRPVVTEDVYQNYKDFINKNKDGKFKDVAEKVLQKTGRDELVPEDIGIRKGQVDMNAFNILNEVRKFNLDVYDNDPAYDSKSNKETWQITFSIPELVKKMPSVYSDAIYTMKIPPSVRSLDPTDLIPVSVQHSYSNPKSGKAGMSLRLDETYEDWTEDAMDTLNDVGFVSKKRFQDFITALASKFKDNWLVGNTLFDKNTPEEKEVEDGEEGDTTKKEKGKNLDKIISDLGGETRFHGKSFGTADDLADLAEQLGGAPSTKEDLRSKREMGDYGKRLDYIKNLTADAIDVAGDKVQGYFAGIDKPQGQDMREAIVKAGNYPTLRSISDNISSAKNIEIGWETLFRSAEMVNKALEFVFHPQVSPGSAAWKTHLEQYIGSEGLLDSPDLVRAAKWILFKEKMISEGKRGAALRDSLIKTTDSEVDQQISNQEAQAALKENLSDPKRSQKALDRLQSDIRDVVDLKLRSNPAFRKFWERQRTWEGAIKPGVNTDVERVFMGDEPIPRGVKMTPSLKKQIVQTIEIPIRGDKVKKEQRINLSDLQTDNLDDLSSFVDNLVDEFITKRLQQAWRTQREANTPFLKLAYERMSS